MKRLYPILIVLLLAVGCNNRRPGEYGKGNGPVTSTTQASINTNIDELATKPWDKAAYTDILENQILSSATLSKGQKEGLRTKLDMYYSRAMVEDMTRNLTENCEKSHSRLAAESQELRRLPLAERAEETLRRYDHHQSEMAFASSIGARQRVSSWRDAYDEGHERRINSALPEHRAQKSDCAYLQRAFTPDAVKRAFDTRRRNYVMDVVKLYAARNEEWSRADERELLIHIRPVVSPLPDEAQRLIDEYRTNHPSKE